MNYRFPQKLILGVSSAAAQIEGGETGSNWNDWYHEGHIKDGSDPAVANRHWERWREDIDLMAEMGIRAYRFGVEWSRLVPEEGRVDEKAIAHYREEIEYMKVKGIEPLCTIHHFSNPMWFEKKGGFEKRENLHYYLELVELVVKSYGDIVSDYITINEPNVYAANGWFFGDWPPGKKSPKMTMEVLSNLAYCHIKAYEMIHTMRENMGYNDTKAAFANHVRVFEPKDGKNPWHVLCAKTAEWLFQGAITRAMSLGEFLPPLRNYWGIKKGEYADFVGVNYYSRSAISGFTDGVMENCPKTDLDWEVYPYGLIRCTEKLLRVLQRPVWVTENGVCDNTDAFRARYICDHLAAISGSGLPFERYYHWCFCDNFEWIEGESARFGIVHVDYKTQKRTIKASGRFYSEISAAGGVTDEIFEKYVKEQRYSVR